MQDNHEDPLLNLFLNAQLMALPWGVSLFCFYVILCVVFCVSFVFSLSVCLLAQGVSVLVHLGCFPFLCLFLCWFTRCLHFR